MTSARLILSCSLLALGACAQTPPPVPAAHPVVVAPVTVPAASQASAHDRLFQLFKESDEASLKRNPVQALFRGDYRYAGHIGDLYSDAHYQREKAAAEHDLAALQEIPRGELNRD